jgi:TIR domain/NB-ARC domain
MLDVFLSYARAENEPLARELYQRLSAAGLAVWWDRECMPSRSLTFLQEIRLAVRDAERTVVIVDGPACRSEYVQAEWQYALAAGKPVVPLLRLESYDDLPPELAGLHCPDFRPERQLDAAVKELLRVLSDEVPPLGRLLGEVPGIPPHYQPRVGATTRLAGEVMLGRNDPVTITGSQRITVLHGMGGSGKSVLAVALARSTATRQAFGDGIVWLAPDADTRPEGLLRGLGDLLGGISRNWQTRSDCVDGVRELLSGRRVLVLIDNATAVDLIEPLISALDVDTRVVVTTRFAGLAADLGARSLHLGDLEPAEALQLLADWARCNPDELPPAAAQLAAECGYLPFALAINGAMVRRGTPWQDLLDAFEEHELEFAQAHERLAHYPYRNVFRAIRPSIVELERSEPQAAERLVELAAFHWAQGVPESAVTRFWVARGCRSARAAREVLTDLADRSLLRLDGEAPRGGSASTTFNSTT